jgi:hypothetical protein
MSKRQCSCGCDNFKLRLTETHVINDNMRRCRNCGHFLSEHITLEDDKNDSRIVAEKSDAIPEDVLVVGPPQLTVNMVESVCAFHEWALDLSLPENVKEIFKENMIDAWRSSKPEYTQGFEEIMKMIQDIEKMEQGARDSLQKKAEQQLVERLKTYTDPVNVALLQLYEAEKAHIAPGNPPLTKEIADASIELINYQYLMAANLRITTLTTEHKVVWRQMLGSQWSNLTADWKNYYIGAPLEWARIQSMSLEEKAAYNQNFKANLPYGYKDDFLSKIMEEVWDAAMALRGPRSGPS